MSNNNNNGTWKATQAERWGWTRAKLEDQESYIASVEKKVEQNYKKLDEVKNLIEKQIKLNYNYVKEMENRVTKVEVKSGLIGFVSGFIGGFIGVISYFKKFFG